jgi:hypothetical protein
MFAVSVFRDRELGRSEVTQIHPLLLTTVRSLQYFELTRAAEENVGMLLQIVTSQHYRCC